MVSEPTGSPTPASLEQALLALALLFASGGGARLTCAWHGVKGVDK